MATSYNRVMLGRASVNEGECLAGVFFGADFHIDENSPFWLPEVLKYFNKVFVTVSLALLGHQGSRGGVNATGFGAWSRGALCRGRVS